jgi:phenylalanyl-tRNA synthetase alpha chain
MGLTRNEVQSLLALRDLGGKGNIQEIAEKAQLDQAAVMRAISTLSQIGLVEISKTERTFGSLTEEGRSYAVNGLPERRIIDAVLRLGGESSIKIAAQHAKLDADALSLALGWVKSTRWAEIKKKNGEIYLVTKTQPARSPDEELLQLMNLKTHVCLEELPAKMQEAFKRLVYRKLIVSKVEKKLEISLTAKGFAEIVQIRPFEHEISVLTPQLIVTGRWRDVRLRRYNVQAPVTTTWPGKKQPYRRFLDEVKARLVALGFKEMLGPAVEFMFFNCDALFMPQDHPAREIHDIYFVKDPLYGRPDEFKKFLHRVGLVHENGWRTGSTGWGYRYNPKEASRLILRSQGTSISARTLISKDLQIPGKYFSIARCYRPDVVDKTHLTEFNQVEGIVVGEELTLRDLLGVLERFAIDLAKADKVRFTPDYFPFTEPSVELAAYKEGYGWLEFGGSGIFRPELTLPLGINVPVIAWGLGVDRLFMMRAGIDDMRVLFTQDLDWIRKQKMT